MSISASKSPIKQTLKPTNTLIVIVILFVLLVLLSSILAFYYTTSSLELSSKGRSIENMTGTISNQNLIISKLQSNITSLNAEIANLQRNVSSLKNLTSALQFELSVSESGGHLGLSVFAYNQTITVPGNTTNLLVSDPNGYNGTLELDSHRYPPGCPSTGAFLSHVQGQNNYYFVLNQYSNSLAFAQYNLNSTPFSIYFRNTGAMSVTCFFTLTYIYYLRAINPP